MADRIKAGQIDGKTNLAQACNEKERYYEQISETWNNIEIYLKFFTLK